MMPRLAVIGAGIMGANHVRLATGLRDAELGFVVDPDPARADALAATFGVKAAATLDDVLDDIDAAIVAAPSELHCELGLQLIAAGKHVMIEKPLATSVDDAQRLVDAAAVAGVTLMAGHVERFNPAVLELDNVVQRDDVVHVSTARISPFSPRIAVGVVLDLLIHDLDLVRSIVRSPVEEVQAVTRCVRSSSEDLASVLLTFENGVTADLSTSRVGQQKIRTIGITQHDSYVNVDLLRQDVTINRVDHSEYVSSEGSRYRQTGMVEIPFLEVRGEPLWLEQVEFVRAITAKDQPRVTGEDGVEALRLALRVLDAAGRGPG
jgi:predicted dehydrogenase